MKNKRFALISLMPFLFSCAGTGQITGDKYEIELMAAGEGDFNVLQLTDIHWNYTTNIKEASDYLTNTINVAKEKYGHIDLLEVTGDSLLLASKKIATTLYDLIDSFNIPWAFTFGNHDYDGDWSIAWMNHHVSSSNYKNALLPEKINKEDEVDGFSNYVINVKWGNELGWQLYNIDTHNLIQEGGSYDYDFIHDNQVEWYKQEADSAKKDGIYTPALAFLHIPTTEIYEFEEKGTVIGGIKDEKFCPGEHDSKFVKAAKERNLKGMFFGHDHSNDIVWKYDNIVYGYGVKANTELYNTEKDGTTLTGCAIYSLHKGGTFDLEHLVIDYSTKEVASSPLTWKENNL